jgi:hypothetical protein
LPTFSAIAKAEYPTKEKLSQSGEMIDFAEREEEYKTGGECRGKNSSVGRKELVKNPTKAF